MARSHEAAASRRTPQALVALALCAVSCYPLFATRRIEDASAPGEYLSAARVRELCAPEVELVRGASQANRPYRQVASLSASCYPGVISECERRLLERACELKADAVILTEPRAGGTPPGGTTDSRVTRSALAVRWTKP